MKKIAVLALSLAMVAMAMPATADEGPSIREQNREFILEQNPNYNPGEIVTVHHNGVVEEMTAANALDIALDRAGDKLLPNLVADEAHGSADLVGDIWLLGFGDVDCGSTTVVAPSPVPATSENAQLFTYAGDIGYNTGSSAAFWTANAWTIKDSASGSGAINYGGISDFFCIGGGWFGFLFPFIDGYTTTQAVPPA